MYRLINNFLGDGGLAKSVSVIPTKCRVIPTVVSVIPTAGRNLWETSRQRFLASLEMTKNVLSLKRVGEEKQRCLDKLGMTKKNEYCVIPTVVSVIPTAGRNLRETNRQRFLASLEMTILSNTF